MMRHLLLISLALVSACTPDFDEIFQVKDLRILALRVDPPEVTLPELTAAVIPAVQFTALVVDPRMVPGESTPWQLWACTPEKSTCDDADQRRLVSEGTVEPALSQIQVSFVPDAQLMAAAIRKDTFKGFGGLPIKLHLKVEDQRLGLTVEAIKRVVYDRQSYTLRIPATPGSMQGACRQQAPFCDEGLRCDSNQICQRIPNQNPALALDLARLPGWRWTPTGLQLPGEPQLQLWPVSPGSAQQSYWVPTFEGGTRQLKEFLTFTFFATSGSLSRTRTGGKPSPFVEKKTVTDLLSVWTIDGADPAPTLWIVARDDRGGVNWLSARVKKPVPTK